MQFKDEFNSYKVLVEEIITQSAEKLYSPSEKLTQAMRYSLLSGGKRLRPVLFLAAFETVQNTLDTGLKIFSAADETQAGDALKGLCFAIEALHTYTLIHDDLPCMDNDDERRGMPSCHIKFGQAHALLAGDALLNLSFEAALHSAALQPKFIDAVRYFFEQTGMKGVIAGQSLEFEQKSLTEELLLKIIENKTAALFKASAVMGGMCAGLPQEKIEILKEFGHNYGMAFQLKDDLSDLNGASFAKNFGIKRTEELLKEYYLKAAAAAKELNSDFFLKIVKNLCK